MKRRILKLWTTSAILFSIAVFIAVTPPSKAVSLMLSAILSVLVLWTFDTGLHLYLHYRAVHPKRVKAWVK